MPVSRIVRRYFDLRHVSKRVVIKTGAARSLRNELFLFSKLMDSNRGQNVAEIVFKTRLDNLVIPVSVLGIAVPRVLTNSMETQNFHFVEQLLVMSDNHSAFACRQILCRIKAVADGIAAVCANRIAGTDWLASVMRTDSVRRVFDNVQSVFSSKPPYG